MTTQTIMLSDISLLRLINSCLNFIAQDGNISLLFVGFNSEHVKWQKIIRVETAIELLRLHLGGRERGKSCFTNFSYYYYYYLLFF